MIRTMMTVLLRDARQLRAGPVAVCLFLASLVYGFDLMTPLGIADGLLYLVVILAGLYFENLFVTGLSACVCTIFVVLGFFNSPQVGVPMYIVAVNRGISIVVIVAAAVAGMRFQLLKRELEDGEAELARANVELESLSRTDSLTGVCNRRCFDLQLALEYRRAVRVCEPLSLLMMDVDYFKNYNDRKGHCAGDECLVRIVQASLGCLRRPGDQMARYGGEEFVILLPGAGRAEAEVRAEAIRAAVMALGIEHPASPVASCVTVSIGIGVCQPCDIEAGPALCVQSADEALYQAKRDGRNCVR